VEEEESVAGIGTLQQRLDLACGRDDDDGNLGRRGTSTINCSAIIGAESSFGTPQARSQVE
jgi:hypothetical protein